MQDSNEAAEVMQQQLLGLLEALCGLAREQEAGEQEQFFRHIHAGIASIREPEDIAGPFMELSTAAFRGFDYSPDVSLLLDRVLAIAHSLAATMSAPSDSPQ